MGWSMRVDKCHDYLEVVIAQGAVEDPEQWPHFTVPGRGDPNPRNPLRPFLWSWKDPTGEEIDLTPVVGDWFSFYMWANIIDAQQTGDHQCDMVVEFDGDVVQRWEFDGEEDHSLGSVLIPLESPRSGPSS